MNDNSDEDLINGSLIGTKDYWDNCYENEIKNFNDFGDLGEVWFGLKNSSKIIDWIEKNVDKQSDTIVDIGCGNGLLLIQMAKKGFKHLFGVDYSSKSIDLCKEIARKELKTELLINFEVFDILSDNLETNSFVNKTKFDCIIDKGTYDAICLMPNIDISDVRQKYRNSILRLISSNGIFIIMSCNFTKEELYKHLILNNSFVLLHEIKSPNFCFGGQTGNQVTGLVLKKL